MIDPDKIDIVEKNNNFGDKVVRATYQINFETTIAHNKNFIGFKEIDKEIKAALKKSIWRYIYENKEYFNKLNKLTDFIYKIPIDANDKVEIINILDDLRKSFDLNRQEKIKLENAPW